MRFCLVLIIVLLNIGCSSRFLEVKKPENVAGFISKIETHNQRVTQVKASIDIKAHGIMAGFFHEQADVVIQAPHFIYWSLRSFFGPPSMILASNGEYLTTYDFSGASIHPYQKSKLYPETFLEFLDFRLHPASIIYIFLQIVPLAESRNLRLSISDSVLEIRGELVGGWHMRSLFDLTLDRILSTELKNDALEVEYLAKYQNFRMLNGIDFPQSMVLSAKGQSRSARLQIEFLQTELNGPLVLPDVFYVKPH